MKAIATIATTLAAMLAVLVGAPAFAVDPEWHTAKIERVLWNGVFYVDLTPSPSAECNNRQLVRVDWPDVRERERRQAYADMAVELLKSALQTNASVRVYLQEHYDSNNRRYCAISAVQVWPPQVASNTGGGNTGGGNTGGGNTGGGNNGGGNNGGGNNGGGNTGGVPENQRAIAFAVSPTSYPIQWLFSLYGRNAADARSKALANCRSNFASCRILQYSDGRDAIVPSQYLGSPYCWAFALRSDNRHWAVRSIARASRATQRATVEASAIRQCQTNGGSCSIPLDSAGEKFSACIGVSGSGSGVQPSRPPMQVFGELQ